MEKKETTYVFGFNASGGYFEEENTAAILNVISLHSTSGEQGLNLLIGFENNVNITFWLGSLLLFARPFNSVIENKTNKNIAFLQFCLSSSVFILDWSERFKDLYQRLFADVPGYAAEKHFWRKVIQAM